MSQNKTQIESASTDTTELTNGASVTSKNDPQQGSTSNGNFTSSQRFLVFTLGDESFAIPLLKVREVIAVPEFTPIPHTPSYFLGISNLRGQIISAINVKRKLGIPECEATEPAIIICDIGSVQLGILVDSVNSVLLPEPGKLSAPPRLESKVDANYITSVYRSDNGLILFMEIERILSSTDQAFIDRASSRAA